MRKLVWIFITAIAFSSTFVTVSRAQAPKCDPASLIAELAALKSTGDNAKDLGALNGVQRAITAQNIACNGYTFTGKGKGIVKPFVLPKGTYVLHFAAASGSISITPKVISGKCADGLYIFTMSMQEAIEMDAFVDSAGCELGLDVDYTPLGKQDWTLTIEPLK